MGCTILQAEMAPAFTSGVDGWSFSNKIAMMELKGKPVASAPIISSTLSTVLAEYQDSGQHLGNGFDTEAIVSISQLDGFSVHQTDTDSEEIWDQFAR